MYNKNLLSVLNLNAQGPGTVNSEGLHNQTARGVKLVIDVTAISGTPSLVVTIQGHDPTSNKNYTILASAAITGVGTTVLTVYPGVPAVANVSVNDVLPIQWNVKGVVTGVGATLTGTIGASLQA